MSFLPSRRTFLQTTLAATASLFLPRFLLARRNPRSFWFLHTPTGESWTVDDPVAWCLENARQPILERARDRLVTLDASDPQRIIRLLTRRCRLNLIEVRCRRVVVHYWGTQGQADLRRFFKEHGLAHRNTVVTSIDRKREASTNRRGDDFLYGERFLPFWPLNVYLLTVYRKKWQRRFIEESDDWTPAPWSESNYCWDGIEQRCVPWRVLKSAWRHETAPACQNCDKPTLLISFGYFVCGFYKLEPTVSRICPLCRSKFKDHSPWDGTQWMVANLDESLPPSYEIMFGQPVKYTLPWTAEGQAHDRNIRLVQCLNQTDRRGMYLYDTSGHIVLARNNSTVHLPPLDEKEDVEKWCRRVKSLIPKEG